MLYLESILEKSLLKLRKIFKLLNEYNIMQRSVRILLIVSGLIMLLNVILLFKYTGYTAQSSNQASINLTIIGLGSSCGNGACSGDETCTSCPADCGSCPVTTTSTGGTGGGGGGAPAKDFFIDKTVLKVLVKQEESFKTNIVIKNTADTFQEFQISIGPSLKNLVFISDFSFSLKPGEEKKIELNFVSTKDTPLGVLTGGLIIKTAARKKEIPISFSIESKIILFDVSLDIPAEYKTLSPGSDLLLQTTLFSIIDLGKTDVLIEYLIKDFSGNIILNESETVSVEKQVSFSKTIKLPKNMKEGDYAAIVYARYSGALGSSDVIFSVKKTEFPLSRDRLFMIIFPVILAVIIIIFFVRYERRKLKDIVKSQVGDMKEINKMIKTKERAAVKKIVIGRKLKKQKESLEKAYSLGYISKESYLKGRERIQNMHGKIKKKYL
mgnify:CR=1 FL=1